MLVSRPRSRRRRVGQPLSGLLVLLASAALAGQVMADAVAISHDGLTLQGILRVSDEADPEQIILMLHGTLAHSGMEIMAAFQERLSDLGLSSLAITLSLGVDKRTGMFDCDQPHRHRHTDAITEIGAWHGWLRSRGYRRILLLGHSRGGNQASLYAQAAAAKRPDALILIAPMTYDADEVALSYRRQHDTSLSELIGLARRKNEGTCKNSMMQVPSFLHCGESSVSAEAFLSYYAPEYEPDTATILHDTDLPVMVILGSADPLTSRLSGRLPERSGIEVLEIEGADHFFRDLYADDASDAIAEFVSGLPQNR